MSKMPNNFSWVIPNKLAGSGYPIDTGDIQFFIDNGIKAIINLSGNPSKYVTDYENQIVEYNISIPDFGVPRVEQIMEIWSIVDKHALNGEAVVIHCVAGCGRTGTILASLLIHLGSYDKIDDAISVIRELRPCSIETKEQVDFLKNNF